MSDKSDLAGIKGWLNVVALNVFLKPVLLMYSFVKTLQPLFENGVWESLIYSLYSDGYNFPLFAIIIGELIYSVVMLIFSLFLIYLFVSKHRLFPKVFIILLVTTAIFWSLDFWLIGKLFPTMKMTDEETTQNFIKIVIQCCVWIPYMLYSERVKATFVEPTKNKEAE